MIASGILIRIAIAAFVLLAGYLLVRSLAREGHPGQASSLPPAWFGAGYSSDQDPLEEKFLDANGGGYDRYGRPVDRGAFAKLAEEEEHR